MWVARNPDGTLVLFKNKPSRCTLETTNLTKGSKRYGKVTTHEFWDEDQVFDGYDKWYYPGDYFEIDSSLFPDLKWEDEPLEVNLVAVPPQNINLDYEVAKALYSELPDKDSLTGISLKNRIDSYEKS